MRTSRSFVVPVIVGALAVAAVAACDKSSGGGTDKNGTIAVNATDTACGVARSEAPAGVTVFTVTNNGSKVTEFYVYAAGDRVMGEVENIGPGVSRDLR